MSSPVPSCDDFVVAAFYKFVDLPDFEAFRAPLLAECELAGALGTILLAREGINGTFCARRQGVIQILNYLKQDPRLADLEPKYSISEKPAFLRMKVRLKKEIVTMGAPEANPNKQVGAYVKPQDWNMLISDADTVVIDTRNSYETAIGSFENALDPNTDSFRDFPKWVEETLTPLKEAEPDKKIAMFCTGGIRCEKATSYLLARGFRNIFHLEGGILKYLEEVPEQESQWQGECFVFDDRVSVGHGLEPGPYDLCHACRNPISQDDKLSSDYVAGVSCPYCKGKRSEMQIARYAARQHQMEVAKQRGHRHLGQAPRVIVEDKED